MGVPVSGVAWVTGGAEGIGWAIAQRLANDYSHVMITDIQAEVAKERAAQLGHGHLGAGADVTNEAELRSVADLLVNSFGRIDVLVNNAGIADQGGATLEQTGEAFEHILQVNLIGTFLASKVVGEFMLANGEGAIVNLSSIAALGGIPTRNAYGAAKAGILSMTRSMACEWGRQGVRVNALAPGYVQTSLVEKLSARGAVDIKSLEARTPLGRLAQPQEIAEAAAFLASSRSSFMTGSVMVVDGGWSALGAPESCL